MTQTVLITGANRGLGLCFCKAYLNKGFNVIATTRNPSSAQSLNELSQIHPSLSIFPLDISSEESVYALSRSLGSISLDILINNAGIFLRDETDSHVNVDHMVQQYRTNAIGPLLLTKTLLPLLNSKFSKVINITSQMGSIQDNTSGSSYGYRASKAALNMLTKSLIMDFRQHELSIAVLMLHPGYVRTDMTNAKGNVDAEDSVTQMILQIDQLTLENSGRFINRFGELLPY